MRWLLALTTTCAFACSDDAGNPNKEPCVTRESAAPAHMHNDQQGTYAMSSCLESTCHLQGSLGPLAPAYASAGTVVTSSRAPQAGATVRFKPLDGGAAIEFVTDDAGNFSVPIAMTNIFPSIPTVTACPDVNTMLEGAQDPSYGSCAVQSCHSLGNGRGPIVLGK